MHIVERFAVGFGIAVSQRVALAKFQWIETKRARHLIHVALDGEHRLHFAGRAKITRRHLIGVDDPSLHAHVGRAIGAGDHERAVHAVARRARAIGAAVVIDFGVPSPEPPVALHPGAQHDHRRVARLAVLQFFLIALDELDRPLRRARQIIGEDDVLGSLFAAEGAAGRYRVNDDHLFGNVGVIGKPLAYSERRLMALPDADAAARIDLHQGRPRFDETLVNHLSAKSVFKNLVRFQKAPFHVAFGGLHERTHIAEPASFVFTFIAFELGMQQRRIRTHRFQRIEHRGQRLIFHVDEIEGLLNGVTVDGGDGRDLLADIAHAILRQHGFIQQAYAFKARRNLFSGKDGFNAAEFLRPADIDLHHASVRIGAAQKPGPKRARAHNVGGIRRASGNFAFAFDATEHAADNAGFHHLFALL